LSAAKNMASKKLFLLDGHALVYRAHFAFITRPLINSKGLNTSAITGFVRTLWDLMKNQDPSHIAVSFDMHGPTFRHEKFPEYKANREEQPEDIKIAIPYIKQILQGFNIPIIELAGFEADDIIGTLAKQAEAEGFSVYMVTPDKDFAQLVSKNIYIYKPSRQGNGIEILGEKEVLKKWDIERVDQVIDVLGLQGDKVDNIPGIPGVGPKTASKLLKEYGSLEEIVANADNLKGKLAEKVKDNAALGILSKDLATIDVNVPIKFDGEAYIISEIDRAKLEPVFQELEFRTLAQVIFKEQKQAQKDLFGNDISSAKKEVRKKAYSVASKDITNVKHSYKVANTKEERAILMKQLMGAKTVCIDTETTGIDPNIADLVGLSFSIKKHTGTYIPMPDDRAECIAILEEIKPFFDNESITKIGQNIKYDIIMLKSYGFELADPIFDTMIAHYLMEPDKRHKLDILSESYLDYKMVPIEDLIGKRGKNQLSMRDLEINKVGDYAIEDADVTLQLKEVFEKTLKEESLTKLYSEIELPLVHVLAAMEFEGVKINDKFLNDYSKELEKLIKETQDKIYKQAEVPFNIASPKQVGQILFEKLQIPYRWRKTATAQHSTNEEKLNELAPDHQIVKDILDYRGLAKLKSTYVDAIPQLINPKTGRVHSSFNQARAATGRLSSENPNLQNIPIKTAAGREIRKAFEPRDKNHVLLAADYSQIELRLIAEISNETAMLDAFIAGHDIHKATASKVYDVPLDEVTADQRRNAKTVNFSIIYGAGALNLSRQLDISRKEAKSLIEQYFNSYPGLKKWMDDTVNFARESGFVNTLMGRKRTLRDINANSSLSRSNAERMAINTPIQGTAADMIKVAMINIHNALIEGEYKTKMIMQVHDELVFDVLKEELEKVKPLIEGHMKNALPNLNVPILVGMGVGKNWLEAH